MKVELCDWVPGSVVPFRTVAAVRSVKLSGVNSPRPSQAFSIKCEPSPNTPCELYLDLLKKALTRALVAQTVERHTVEPVGLKSKVVASVNRLLRSQNVEVVRLIHTSEKDYLESGHAATNRAESAETMLGTRQLDQMQMCIRDVIEKQVPGDLLEAGVWRGGMTIFMRGCLKALQVSDRTVWVVDSFEGLPTIDRQKDFFAWDQGDMAVGLESVKANFSRYGLLDDQVVFLKGYFSDTLPGSKIGPLAILRVDADLYTSTLDVLENLYSRLSPGGYAIFDDYHNLPDCKRAIEEFRAKESITEPVITIDQRAVYWQKRA